MITAFVVFSLFVSAIEMGMFEQMHKITDKEDERKHKEDLQKRIDESTHDEDESAVLASGIPSVSVAVARAKASLERNPHEKTRVSQKKKRRRTPRRRRNSLEAFYEARSRRFLRLERERGRAPLVRTL